MALPKGNPFSSWSQGWQRNLETQTGNTPLHSRKGFQLGWMNLLWHPGRVAHEGRTQRKSGWLGKISPHLQVATTMIQLKPAQILSKRHSLKKKPWAWWRALSPSRKQRTTVMDCVHGIHWLRAAREVSTAESAPQEQRATADGVDPMAKGSVWHWPDKDPTFLLLKADVSKAHRRIKILRSGWKYQVAQIDQQWWVNKVGTYGVASAQLYWGRMAALLLRILYALFPEHLHCWGFSWLWEPHLVGRRQSFLRSTPGWGLSLTSLAHLFKWPRRNMWQSWNCSRSWRKGRHFPSKQLRKL